MKKSGGKRQGSGRKKRELTQKVSLRLPVRLLEQMPKGQRTRIITDLLEQNFTENHQ